MTKDRKPTIVKRFSRWYCGYRCLVHFDCIEGIVGRGSTPMLAYNDWKYQMADWQRDCAA